MKAAVILSFFLLSFGLLSVAAAESTWVGKAFSIFKSPAGSAVGTRVFADASQLAGALREALAVSAERALTTLSRKGGFANSEAYRIPLPDAVEKFRKPLALVRQDYRLDEFQAAMNAAAEAGVAAAPGIVRESIEALALEDLDALWKGESDAITRFLEKRAREPLGEKMLPLIAKATDSSGATRSYKAMLDALPKSGGGLFSRLQSFTGIGVSDFDLDTYVNEKALDALFAAMAAEEKNLRENPMARTTDLLKQLFGE